MKLNEKLTLLVLGVALMASPGLAGTAADAENPRPALLGSFCNPAGTWLGVGETGSLNLTTVAPAQLGEFSSVNETVAFDPSFGGALPAVDATLGRGTLRRTGRRSFDVGGLRYGWDADLAVVWIERSESVFEMERGCDAGTSDGLFHYYGAWQDPFGDEPPAFGTFPGHLEFVRLLEP